MGFPADFATNSGKDVGKEEPMESAPDPFFAVIVLIIFSLLSCTTTKVNQSTRWYEFLVLVHEPECQTQINKP